MNNSPSLALKHIFGYRFDVLNGLHFIDETSVLYCAGHSTVIHSLEDEKQIFCPGLNHGPESPNYGICAIDVSPSKRFCAIAECGERGPIISILSCSAEKIKRKKKIEQLPTESREIISVKFSPDEKHLLVLCGGPNWCLINYLWEKQRPTQVINNLTRKGVLTCASFCPMDPHLVVVTGQSLIRFLRIDAHEFKIQTTNLSKRDTNDYTCHSWDTEKRLLVGTFNSEILVFEGHEFKGAFETGTALPIVSIQCTTKGFVCGCDNGVLLCFEKGGEKQFYTQVKKLQFPHCVNVSTLALSPTEEYLAVSLLNRQSYMINLSHLDIEGNQSDFSPLFSPIHSHRIHSIDLCIRKPWIVSCGTDRMVRIYNWLEPQLIVQKQFKQEPLCVAFHPSGFHILVGFNDKLRFMNVLIDDIIEYREFPMKGCRYVRFSNGGQYFAAVNSGSIQIYNTYSCHNIANLRGHTGKVNSVCWAVDDMELTTASNDSTVQKWCLRTSTRIQTHQSKGVLYNSAVTTDRNEMCCVGNDSKLIVLVDGKVENSIQFDVLLTHLELGSAPHNLLFGGTKAGYLKMFSLPINRDNPEELSECWIAHSAEMTGLRVSDCGQIVASCADDGSIVIFDVKDNQNIKKKESQNPFTEEILVGKKELERRIEDLEQLKNLVETTKEENTKELELIGKENEATVEKKQEEYKVKLEEQQKRHEELTKQKNSTIAKYDDILEELSHQYEQEKQSLNTYYKKKIKSEVVRYETLETDLKCMREKWKNDGEERNKKHIEQLEIIRCEYQKKIEQVQEDGEKYEKDYFVTLEEFQKVKKIIETDAENEIKKMISEYDHILRQERSSTLDLKGNNGMLKREFAALKQKITSGNDKLVKSNEQLHKLDNETHRLEKDIQGYEREIQERETTIQEKDRMITELRKKNQELEKFKFVLDYKIAELDRQIKPRELTIDKISSQITEMKEELEEYASQNFQCELELSDITLKLQAGKKEEQFQKQILKDISRVISAFRRDLQVVAEVGNNPSKLKAKIKKLYHDYGSLQTITEPLTAKETQTTKNDVNEIFLRRRDFLKQTIQSIETQMITTTQRHEKKVKRYMQENTFLLKELNELREEIEELEP